MREEYDKETLGCCSPSLLNPFYYSATIIFEIMDLKYHPPSAEHRSPMPMQTMSVFITKDEGFPLLLQNFMVYGAISGAPLNLRKSNGLFAGRWRKRKTAR
jgi:hypothetical protein